ncbi:response regulator [Pedobacter sp. P351]|uniref:response regulator n=1 Tax=Pedobacter superstes TaxID=3133441 RepID=UPI0030B60FA0
MRKILLIDDDEDFREGVAEILQLSNYVTLTAPDGKTGVEKALKEKPDLIICDVSMPHMDGFSVLHILSRHPETVAIPFIFMTGKNELTDIRKGMGMGADDYLVKPFDETDLLNSIEMRLSKTNALKGKLTDIQQNIVTFIKEIRLNGTANLAVIDSSVHKYKKKHILYSEGQKASAVFFMVSGKVKEYMINEDGKELITNMYGKGDFIGYTTVLENSLYNEAAQIIEDAELLLIPKKDFLQLLNNNLQVANEFINMLSHNVVIKDQKLLQLAYSSLRKKVATGIIEVIDKFKDKRDGKPVIEISREDLANVIGAAQESLSRTLKEFKNENLIDMLEGNIVVLNDTKLRQLGF